MGLSRSGINENNHVSGEAGLLD